LIAVPVSLSSALLAILSLATWIGSGFGIATALFPSIQPQSKSALWFKIALSFLLGIGFSTLVSFLLLIAGGTELLNIKTTGVILILCALTVVFKKMRGTPAATTSIIEQNSFASSPGRLIRTVYFLVLSTAIVSAVLFLWCNPHGQGDSYIIYNMRAKFLFTAGAEWRKAFDDNLFWSHLDYPLLIPLAVLNFWQWFSDAVPIVPALVAFLFTASVAVIVQCGVTLLKGSSRGLIAASLLISTPYFLKEGLSQMADIPVAAYVSACFVTVLLSQKFPKKERTLLLLSGMLAGLCGWTKNEGLLFFCAITLVYGVVIFRSESPGAAMRKSALILAGALPSLAVVLTFKVLFPHSNEVLGQHPLDALPRLMDATRYWKLLYAYFVHAMYFGGWILTPTPLFLIYALMSGIDTDRIARFNAQLFLGTFTLVILIYSLLIMISPNELDFQIWSTLNRLLFHYYPALVIFTTVSLSSPKWQDKSKTAEASLEAQA